MRRRFRAEAEQTRREGLSDEPVEALESQARKRWVSAQLVTQGMRQARRLGWHDVYTFTKALGELLVLRARGAASGTSSRSSALNRNPHSASASTTIRLQTHISRQCSARRWISESCLCTCQLLVEIQIASPLGVSSTL